VTALPQVGAARGAGRPAGAAAASETWSLRLAALTALMLFGGAHWAGIVRPSAGGDLFGMLIAALATGVALAAVLELRGRVRRAAAVAALALAALGAILIVAGVPAAALRPDRWDTLASQLGNAIATLPALRVPYRGTDPWVRAVLEAGGGLLMVAAACLALAPRPRVFAAAFCLGVLYAVAIVEHRPAHPYLDGAVFALLLGALVWVDRLRQREAPVAVALAVVAVLASAIAAPHIDSQRPWVDYEALAESLQAGKSTTFTWNHSYAPLTWPRDGLELARVRTRGDLYIKTANLDAFDGTSWRQERDLLASEDDTEFSTRHPEWRQRIHVTIKGLRSTQFLSAGFTTYILNSSKTMRETTPGTFATAAKPLRRGDSYDADVYVPKPGPVELHTAGTDYPLFVSRELHVMLPAARGSGVGAVDLTIPPWGSAGPLTARGRYGFFELDPQKALAGSPYGRAYRLASQLRDASSDPYDYVGHVIARVQRGARYTESPPSPGTMAPLEAFLFRDRAGYCQHFAGATALLLRLGGVPARVVAGFSPGSSNGEDHVLRDLDAHSWVEAYFPRLGWVTFDPTPGDSPARSQQTDTRRAQPSALTAQRGGTTAAGDRLSDPSAGGAAAAGGGGGAGATLPVAGLLALLALVGGGTLLAVRRRRRLARTGDPELEELRLALERSGRGPTPDVTLARLERLLSGSDGALGYLRALRLARYGGGAPAPTAAQRRALRRELGAGLGMRGRVRALWALPPRFAEVVDVLRPRRRRSYTA
jgi:transglutaminase-like putative cysteine protease